MHILLTTTVVPNGRHVLWKSKNACSDCCSRHGF